MTVLLYLKCDSYLADALRKPLQLNLRAIRSTIESDKAPPPLPLGCSLEVPIPLILDFINLLILQLSNTHNLDYDLLLPASFLIRRCLPSA